MAIIQYLQVLFKKQCNTINNVNYICTVNYINIVYHGKK